MIGKLDRAKIKHVVTVSGLLPNTAYDALITATDKSGKTVKTKVTFRTAAPGSAPATVTTRGNKLLLNGSPWFMTAAPVSGGCPASEVIKANADLGVLALIRNSGFTCEETSDPAEWASILDGRMKGLTFWMEHAPAYDVSSKPNAFPESLNWTGSMSPFPSAPTITRACSATGLGEPVLYDTVRRASLNKPTVYSLELISELRPAFKNCLTGADLSRVFWLTVAAGGDGFAFVTQEAAKTDANGNGPVIINADVQTQLKTSLRQMATLGPCILAGRPLTIKTDQKSAVKVAAWKYGKTICIIAGNSKDTPERKTFSIPGMSGTELARVFWKNRNLKIGSEGVITETFPASGVEQIVITKK
jgi:hypothetical protein